MTKPLMTSIILVYHDEEYLAECVSSLRNSAKVANVNLQIIIVVNDRRLKDSNFPFPKNCTFIFNKQNLGFGKSINLATKKARGNWLIIINIDTTTHKNTLRILLQHKNENNIGIIVPKILNADKSLQYSLLEEPSLLNIFLEQSYLYKLFPKIFKHSQAYTDLYSYSHTVKFISGAYFLIRRNLFSKIGSFDERFFVYYEDIDLCKRVRSHGYMIYYESKAEITHFKHQSFGGIKNRKLNMESLTIYLYKWHSYLYTKITVTVVRLGSFLRLQYWSLAKNLNKKYLTKITV